jgi:hypothetical protein
LDDTVKKLEALQLRASTVEAKWGVVTGGENATAKAHSAAAPSTTDRSPDVLVGGAAWVKNNWVYMAVGVFVLLFLLSQLLKG